MTDVNPQAQHQPGSASDRRQAGRLICAHTQCQLGEVRDLSRTGVRVVSKRSVNIPDDACVHLTIEAQGQTLVLPARPTWTRKRADGRHETGFQFLTIGPEMTTRICQFARTAVDNRDLKRSA